MCDLWESSSMGSLKMMMMMMMMVMMMMMIAAFIHSRHSTELFMFIISFTLHKNLL